MTLSKERCEVCRPGMRPLDETQMRELAAQLASEWTTDGGRLQRTVRVDGFAPALALAVHIGMLAEAEGHHPDLHVAWGRLHIELWTHAADGLTRNDFVLAAKIDEIPNL